MLLAARKFKPAWHIALAVGVAVSGHPRGAAAGPGDYGATFLKIPVGARLMASPDVVVGMQPDAGVMYSNPAFLSAVDGAGVFVSSSRWLDQLSFTSVGAAIPLGRGGTVLGVGTSLLYSGGLDGYDDALNVVDEQGYYDLGMDVVVGHRVGTTGLSLAAGATYIREHVVPEDGSGYVFHAGAAYRLGPTLVHVSLRDFGGSVSFPSGTWSIAPEWTAGAGRAFRSAAGTFLAGMQASSSDVHGTRIRLGVDYALNEVVTLRTGLNDNLDEAQPESRFNAGLGLRYGAMSFEYAYTPQEYFSGTHTFSLGYSFGMAPRGGGLTPTVPPGDFAPPVPSTRSDAPVPDSRQAPAPEFVLVAGAHATAESARQEADMLARLGIASRVEAEGPRFRVVVASFGTFADASRARNSYRAKGHDFQIFSR